MAPQRSQTRKARGPGEPGCFESLLRFVFVTLNYLLLAVGLLLMGYAIYVFKGVRHSPDQTEQSADCGGKDTQRASRGHGVHRLDRDEDDYAAGTWDEFKPYWFAFVIAAMGFWTFLTGVFGVCGVKCNKVCCLGTYTLMLLTALVCEGIFGIIFYFEKGWNWDLPADNSGQCKEFRELVQKHLRISLYIALVALVLQLSCLLLGTSLRSWLSDRIQDAEDEAEALSRQPLITPDVEEGSGTTASKPRRADLHSQMREKYGLDAR